MGNDNAGPSFHQRLQRILDGVLRDGVQRRCGLVQDQNLRVLQNDPGDAEALLFSAGKLQPPVADYGVIAVGLGSDEVVQIGYKAGGIQFLLGGIFLGVKQVFADGAVEEVAVLGHHADAGAEILKVKIPHVDARDLHTAAKHIVEPGDQVHYRRLA